VRIERHRSHSYLLTCHVLVQREMEKWGFGVT
jgi:hypothetical protein